MKSRRPGNDFGSIPTRVALGLYVAASIGKERERCLAHVRAASQFGRPALCIPYILNGERIHPKPKHWERYAIEAARLDCAEAASGYGYEKKVLPPPRIAV